MFQFWIHTDLVKRLWFGLEYLVNSPSAHRMHHRPPGNCNYGGVLIVWDRMFGTFVPEVVRRDYYGLAKQPNTFDPVKLNLQHYATLANLKRRCSRTTAGQGRGTGALAPQASTAGPVATVARVAKNLGARRVRWKWVFDLKALFAVMPADGPLDRRPEGPVRKKWNGHRPFSGAGYGLRAAVHAATLALSVVLLLSGQSLHPYDACGATVCGLALLSCMGCTWDNLPGEAEKALVLAAGLLLPAMVAVVFLEPARRAFGEGTGK
jgi:hypothetical protein